MPLVNVRVIEGVFTPEEKSRLITNVTDAITAVEGGEGLRDLTLVIIDEVKSGDWGLAGTGLTTADAHAARGHTPVSQAS